jgi:hypothetical protein
MAVTPDADHPYVLTRTARWAHTSLQGIPMRASSRRQTVIAVMLLGAVLSASPSAVAASVCSKLQYKVAAAGAKAKAACYAKAAESGSPVDATCLAIAEEKLAKKWVRATVKGDCATNADAADAQAVVDAFIAALADILEPPGESHCCATATTCLGGPNVDPAACSEFFGTLGPPGSICDGATGACVAPPGTGGPCCMIASLFVCTAGPSLNLDSCNAAGGFPVSNGVCLPTGLCAFP